MFLLTGVNWLHFVQSVAKKGAGLLRENPYIRTYSGGSDASLNRGAQWRISGPDV
jgi:hypothetical protein